MLAHSFFAPKVDRHSSDTPDLLVRNVIGSVNFHPYAPHGNDDDDCHVCISVNNVPTVHFPTDVYPITLDIKCFDAWKQLPNFFILAPVRFALRNTASRTVSCEKCPNRKS